MNLKPALCGLAAVSLLLPVAAQAQYWGGWGRPYGFGRSAFPRNDLDNDQTEEGKVDVARFVTDGDAAKVLGHGSVTVVLMEDKQAGANRRGPQDFGPAEDDGPAQDAAPVKTLGPPDSNAPKPGAGDRSTYEAAVIDRLIAAGYNTQAKPGAEDQVVELHIKRSVVQPQEAPHKPVSGEMEVGVSNRGSMLGMGLNIDLTKPKKALLATRMEIRIRSRESGKVLWEGRADIDTREADSKWSDQAIAFRLAGSLFNGFPTAGDKVAVR